MLCKNCGSEIPNTSMFCPLCGESLSQQTDQTVAPQELETEQPFYMPRAEDRPGLTEKPPKQELPIVKNRKNKALFISAGILFALFFLYGLFNAVFIERGFLLNLIYNMTEIGYKYLLLVGTLVLCIFCFVRGSRNLLLYLIPLGIIALAYIWMTVIYFIVYLDYYFIVGSVLMFLIIVLLMLTVTGVIKSSLPALFILLLHIGSDFYYIYASLYYWDKTFLDILYNVLPVFMPVLFCTGLLLFAEASARKKTL